jgi:hypothetical protein
MSKIDEAFARLESGKALRHRAGRGFLIRLINAHDVFEFKPSSLGRRVKTSQSWTGQNRPVREPPQA